MSNLFAPSSGSLFSSSRGSLFGRSSSSMFPSSGRTRSPWPVSGFQPDLTKLDPEQLARLQLELQSLNLTQEPKPAPPGGILGKLQSGIQRIVPGDADTDFMARALEQVAEGLVMTPVGMFFLGKSVATDVSNVAQGDIGPSKTLGLLGDMGEAIYEDVRHPLRNPGYLALDAFAAASMGMGAVTRLRAGAAGARASRLPPERPLLEPGTPVKPQPPPVKPPPLAIEEIPSTFTPRVPALQRGIEALARTDDPAMASRIADEIILRLEDVPTTTPERLQSLIEPVAPAGSEIALMIERQLEAASQRRLQAVRAQQPQQAAAPPKAVERLLDEEVDISGPRAYPGELSTYLETDKAILQERAHALDPATAEAVDLVNAISDDPAVRTAMKASPFEYNIANFAEIFFRTLESDPARVAELRAMAEKVAGLDQQRKTAARQVTAAADEVKAAERLLEDVGFRAMHLPHAEEGLAITERFRPKSYTITRLSGKQREARIYDHESMVVDPRHGPKPKDTGVSVRPIGTRDIPSPTIPYGILGKKGEIIRPPSRPEQTLYQIFDEGDAVGPKITSGTQAIRHAQIYAAEKSMGIEPRLRSIMVGEDPYGTLGPGSTELAREMGMKIPIAGRDALEVAREAKNRAKLREKEAKEREKARRRAEREDEEGWPQEEETWDDVIGEADELDDVGPDSWDDVELSAAQEEMLKGATAAQKAADAQKAAVPPDTPVERTPAVSQEQRAAAKEQMPDDMADVVDDVYDMLEEQQHEWEAGRAADPDEAFFEEMMREAEEPRLRAEAAELEAKAPSEGGLSKKAMREEARREQQAKTRREHPRLKGTSARQRGLSDRQLDPPINPKALERAGLTSAQGNALRGPLRELAEGGKHTPEEAQAVLKEVLQVSDEEAIRIFDDMRGGKALPTDVKMVPGSLKGHFKQLWLLDDAQAQQAANAFKERIGPLREKAKAEGRAPNRQELLSALEEIFGAEKGKEAFKRLYKSSGGSGESAVRAFLREFFKTPERERYTLRQYAPMQEVTKERVLTPKIRKTASGEVIRRVKETQRTERRQVMKLQEASVSLSRNPFRKMMQKGLYKWLQEAPYESRRGRMLAKKIKFEKDELARIENYLETAGMSPDERAALDAELSGRSRRTVGDWIDTLNQLATIGVLYLKPAYIPPNLLGQILFTTIDHTWNPLAISRSWKLHREIASLPGGKEALAKMDAGIGSGMYMSIGEARGASQRIARAHTRMGSAYAQGIKVKGKTVVPGLDTPFRRAAFINEAWKNGFKTPEQMIRLLDAKPGSALYAKLLDIFQNGSRNIVDYGRLSNREKSLVRRMVFFYPWIKGSTVWTGRFISEHPAQALFSIQAGRQGAEEVQDILGPLPSYMRGIIPIGEREIPGVGKFPTIVNPQAFSVTGSAGDVAYSLKNLLFGGPKSEQLAEYLSPFMNAAVATATGTDPFTGSPFPAGTNALDIATQQFFESMPFVRQLSQYPATQEALGLPPGKQTAFESGELDPRDALLPTTRKEELMRFITGLSPVTYNPEEGQQRAIAESPEYAESGTGADLKWEFKKEQSLNAARSAGVLKPNENFPEYVNTALEYQHQRERMYDLIKSEQGKDIRMIDRMRGDLQILVMEKRMSQGEAQQLLLQYSHFDDDSISYFRRKLADAFFNLPQLYAYRKYLKSRGVDEQILSGWDTPS